MITEDYVSFETAKLMKEKGFNEYCKSVYHVGSICSVASLGYHYNEGYGAVVEEKQNSDFGKYDNAISAPTLQMAMKWLREEHNKSIEVRSQGLKATGLGWVTEIYNLRNQDKEYDTVFTQSYEEACEVAIKYCLEKLI